MNDSQNNPKFMSPVAEYLGVCVVERTGSIKKIWQGKTYYTDGLTYVIRRLKPGEDTITVVGLDSERQAKEYIDELSLAERADLYSMLEFWREILQDTVQAVPKYAWDERTGTFVQITTVTDGLTRVGYAKGLL